MSKNALGRVAESNRRLPFPAVPAYRTDTPGEIYRDEN